MDRQNSQFLTWAGAAGPQVVKMDKKLKAALQRYFSQFASTFSLVDDLIKSRSRPQEALILLCSRLDAVACSSARDDEPRGPTFANFITRYGGHADLFRSISVGDLYYELAFHRWLLPGLVTKPGRLHMFSRLDKDVLLLFERSGIALTEQDCDGLLRRTMEALRANFRALPHQPSTKRPLGKARVITDAVVDRISHSRSKVELDQMPEALRPLLNSKAVATILYQRFRCESIHGGMVRIDEERFFREDRPYYKPLYSDYYGAFRMIEFPARFLSQLLRNCLTSYERHLCAKGKVPPDVHFQAFDDDMIDNLEFLDEGLLPLGGPIGLRLR